MKSHSGSHVTQRRVGTGDPELSPLSPVAPENRPLDVETCLQIRYFDSATPPQRTVPKSRSPISSGLARRTIQQTVSYSLKEHDNMVQFKDIRINPDWLPMTGGHFDTKWQIEP